MMKLLLDIICNRLLRPLREDKPFLLFFAVLLSIHSIWYQILDGNYSYSVYVISMYFLVAYCITFLCDLSFVIGKAVKTVLCFVVILFSIIDITSKALFNVHISFNVVEIFANTNIDEFTAFTSTFISLKVWILVFFALTSLIILAYWTIFCNKYTDRKLPYSMLVLCMASVVAVIHNPGVFDLFEERLWDFRFDELAIDLTKYKQDPQIESVSDVHPEKIVLIIGESASRTHYSLYGYNKNTSPRLTQLKSDSTLFVFDNVISPALYTVGSFKLILNTFKNGDEGKWYNTPTMIETFRKAGYKTYWLSNQSEVGVYDNLPASYSSLCDKVSFSERPKMHDEVLLPVASQYLEKGKQFIVFHLMGQHGAFADRYPQDSFSHFTADDYPSLKEHQRKNISEYDNATLYNDYIVSELMKAYATENAVVCYFSDHGLDLYESSPTYATHANENDPVSKEAGQKIPFMFYLSPIFQSENPELVQRILRSQATSSKSHYSTDCLIYTMMDIAGFEFAGDITHNKYSILYE